MYIHMVIRLLPTTNISFSLPIIYSKSVNKQQTKHRKLDFDAMIIFCFVGSGRYARA